MAGLTLARQAPGLTTADEEGIGIPFTIKLKNQVTMRINPLESPGQDEPLPDELVEDRPPSDPWCIVAPGVVVRAKEYQARYAGLDLTDLRRRMGPEVFLAYVRHIGVIEGPPNVDINELVSEEAD